MFLTASYHDIISTSSSTNPFLIINLRSLDLRIFPEFKVPQSTTTYPPTISSGSHPPPKLDEHKLKLNVGRFSRYIAYLAGSLEDSQLTHKKPHLTIQIQTHPIRSPPSQRSFCPPISTILASLFLKIKLRLRPYTGLVSHPICLTRQLSSRFRIIRHRCRNHPPKCHTVNIKKSLALTS
ncbi:hypothetical protein EYC84_008583 [Monilinia fructicola]|uniref:Uncharacterized protein n=1 Tax=Monilinia fructicola TaxID=38448 RepID=A0A5M9JFP4_MONFR|nr:hypothetical protein EYC84_008583 [Monilinia fructicola]